MPDKKLTDNLANNSPILANELSDDEIKKALEYRLKVGGGTRIDKEVLDLINRQEFRIHQQEKIIMEIQDANLIDFKATVGNYRAENENLKAEVERLEAEIDKQYEIAEANVRAEIASGGTSCHWCEDKVRAEAYKEFAERLKEKNRGKTSGCVGWIDFDDIDNLLNELVGDKNAGEN